jgi:hypothetical protein
MATASAGITVPLGNDVAVEIHSGGNQMATVAIGTVTAQPEEFGQGGTLEQEAFLNIPNRQPARFGGITNPMKVIVGRP